MSKFWKSTSLLLTPLMVLGLQVGTLGVAHAAGDADLRVDSFMLFSNSAVQVSLINDGTDDVTEIVLDQVVSNTAITDGYVMQPFSDLDGGSMLGSFDFDTKTWTGNLKQGDGIAIVFEATETSSLGSTVDIATSIVSSELSGGPNLDPNSSNDTSLTSYTSVAKSDLNVETRLKTTGVITPTTNVTYEATFSSVGPGALVDNGFFIFAFIMPEDSTFVDAVDTDLGDNLNLLGCQVIGPIGNLGFEALNNFNYTGDVVACNLSAPSGLPAGTEYKLDFNMTAGETFAAGNAEVIVVVESNDAGTLPIFRALGKNTDPLAENTGNFVYLSYDPTALAATASLCPNQPAVSTDGTACFRISFNKDIVEETFGLEDIAVTGSGTASSLTKIGDNLWELRITGIVSGKEATISLNTGGIVDYSAVQSNTSVLGINTIRFADTAGTLPETGNNSSNALTAFALLLTGFVLTQSSKRKRIVSRARYSL
jgi:LPXTG-motif cell wall-anchored protein